MEAMKGCSRTIQVPDESGKPRSVEVAIPQGVDSGMRLQMQGQGGKGTKGLPRGHLFVNVVVRPDKRFVRDGDDVHVQVRHVQRAGPVWGLVEVLRVRLACGREAHSVRGCLWVSECVRVLVARESELPPLRPVAPSSAGKRRWYVVRSPMRCALGDAPCRCHY
jgi:hypothetical protein